MNNPMGTNKKVCELFASLYQEVFAHDGYGEIRIEMRLLKRGQKEVILHCGKQYRFVVNWPEGSDSASADSTVNEGEFTKCT